MDRTIVLLSLAAFASASSMRVMDALLVRLSGEFGVGLASASDTVTVFAVLYGLLQLVMGPLGDRHGKLRVIAAACGASAVSSLACALAPSFATLLLARAATGASCACIIPLSMAWVGDTTPYETRQVVLARFLLGQIIGLSAGAALGGFAAESGWWQWPFAALAAWFLVVGAVLGRTAWRRPSEAHAAGRGRRALRVALLSRAVAGSGAVGPGRGRHRHRIGAHDLRAGDAAGRLRLRAPRGEAQVYG